MARSDIKLANGLSFVKLAVWQAFLTTSLLLALVASCIIVLYAIYLIEQILKKGLKPAQINESQIYFLDSSNLRSRDFAKFIEVPFIVISSLKEDRSVHNDRNTLIMRGVASLIGALSQILLCKLLYDLGTPF